MPRMRRGRRGRGCWIHEKPLWLSPLMQKGTIFLPVSGDAVLARGDPIVLYPEELEAYRLVYLEGRTQEEAAQAMGISRGALWRLLYSARRKIGLALVQRRPILLLS